MLKLKKYIENNILSNYEKHDRGHNRAHVDMVITNALLIAEHYEVDKFKVYVAAAYHDSGILQGRKLHHKYSADIVLNDSELKKFFSKEDLYLISEACEDHRASSLIKPRSLLGLIISDADKLTTVDNMIDRSYFYTVDHNPELNEYDALQNSYNHLVEKFGVNGYSQLYLDESKKLNDTIEKDKIFVLSSFENYLDRFYKKAL